MIRLLSAAIAVNLLFSACTGSDATTTTVAPTAPATTANAPVTTVPQTILNIGEELSLTAGQCWGELPTPQPATTVPASPMVAIVDCAGPNLGLVYRSGCLASEPVDTRDPVVEIECPGRAEDPWPGLREIEPAVAAACLPSFEAGVGEKYATSDLDAIELVPTEELWSQGDRRFVCTAQKLLPSE